MARHHLRIKKIIATQDSTLIDFGFGMFDARHVYPYVHAAPPEHRAQMLREMRKGCEFGPNMAPVVSEQKGLKNKIYINQ